MKEMNFEAPHTQVEKGKSSSTAMAAIAAILIISLACIGASIATVILVLDAVPFNHIFPN
jgi:F0F1-type ATP synthase membrane subunit c/vacuolar-type H+-ATPase subunit K